MTAAARRLKVLVFLDHAILVRHFVDSGAFADLATTHDVCLVVPPDGHKRMVGAEDIAARTRLRILRLPENANRTVLWKRMFQVERLRGGADHHRQLVAEGIARAIGPYTARIYRLYGLPLVWPIFRFLILRRLAKQPDTALEAIIGSEKPDVLVHPTVLDGIYINDLAQTGRRHGLPFVAIMNSWDNPATKRTMVDQPDWLLVWGEQTRRHAVRYAGMRESAVVPFGVAQFEVYRNPPRQTREVFLGRHGISAASRVLLYAGSSKGTDEYADLERLENAIEAGILPNTAVIYRPHPWGNCGKDGGRIGLREWKHVRIEQAMAGYVQACTTGLPGLTTPDYSDTRDLMAAVDCVASPLSTILLEAAINGRCSICIIDDADVENWFLQISMQLVHFKEFFERQEFLIAKGAGELVERCVEGLAAAALPETRQRLVDATRFFVEPFDAPFSRRLVKFIEGAARRDARTTGAA